MFGDNAYKLGQATESLTDEKNLADFNKIALTKYYTKTSPSVSKKREKKRDKLHQYSID